MGQTDTSSDLDGLEELEALRSDQIISKFSHHLHTKHLFILKNIFLCVLITKWQVFTIVFV